jgi:hypothetical protein
MAIPMEVKATCNANFKAIREAIQSHWNTFVKLAQPKDLWALHRLSTPKETDTLPSFSNTLSAALLKKALIAHFLPPLNLSSAPLQQLFAEAPDITPTEVLKALAKFSNSSTVGPDQIPYGT